MNASAKPATGLCAILFGDPGEAPGFEASRYQTILWFVVGGDSMPPLPGAEMAVVQTVAIDGLRASDVALVLVRFQRQDPFQFPPLFVAHGFANDDATAGVLAQVRSWLERRQQDRALISQVGFARQKNFLLNVTDFVRHRVPATWAGALRGVPALVCGAGPSLDVSVAALAPVADRGVVFAADSALHALARYGVEVDFAVSMSSRKPPERCLPAGMERARVVLASISPASWREVIGPDRQYFLSRPHPTEDMLHDMGVAPAAVESAENCGLTALELARFLGCSPIYVFGLDLAVGSADPAHHRSADADPTIARAAPPATLPCVPGNYAVDVPTIHYADWKACDARLTAWPRDLVYNVNDRGARLHNTRLVHPRQFVLAGAGGAKRRALAHLAPPSVPDAAAAREAFAAIGAQGAIGCRVVAELRGALARGGAAVCREQFQALFARRDFARTFGSFTEKMMPHLGEASSCPPELWPEWIDELEELGCLAESVYGASLV